ncbi:MAG: hypothetical protein ACHQ01_07530 [Candidatus Limnocylindrales bacterium]
MSSKLEDGRQISGDRCVAGFRLAKRDHSIGELGCRLRGCKHQSCHELLPVRAGALVVRKLNKSVETLVQGTRETDCD